MLKLFGRASRLIRLGGAKAMTQASNLGEPELDIGGPQEQV